MITMTVRNASEQPIILAGKRLAPGEHRSGVNSKLVAQASAVYGEDTLTILSSTEPETELAAKGQSPDGVDNIVSDFLTTINGIGPATAKELNELGILTVQDLAKTEAETLAEAGIASLGKIQEWQNQIKFH